MAIAHAAAEYVFGDLLLKEAGKDGNKQREVRVELGVDKLLSVTAVALPLLLISLAFAQEVSVGTPISCFAPMNFSWRQAAYVDNYCWAAVQTQETGGLPLSLHKFFPYILLLTAVLVYVPSLFWRFTAAPVLSSDLSFIMDELDRSYNRAINLTKYLDNASKHRDTHGSVQDLTESCFKYPLAEQYLKTKRSSRVMLVHYLLCRASTLMALILACVYLCYYIRLTVTDEFRCNIRTGVLLNDSSVPPALQCKLVAVGVFRLLSYVNLVVYVLLAPVCLYSLLVPIRSSAGFLKPYEILPTLGVMEFGSRTWDDLTVYLLFLQENLTQLNSYKCLKVLEMLQQNGAEGSDPLMLLHALRQVKSDVLDGRLKPNPQKSDKAEKQDNCLEMKEVSPLLDQDRAETSGDENAVRHRVS
ncbi:pannexin-1a isoform X1 [Trichomycterus rosablanca]|uniref:pannexin-1a isoform X1 n=1 Tax=Trichomycterus rosablanca TaxID=2290929 RepID=UPI002F359419